MLAHDLKVWFAMQATHQREKQVSNYLKDVGIEYFVPLKYKINTRSKSKKLELTNAVPNLIFINISTSAVKELQKRFDFLQFHNRLESGLYYPIIVPDKQMTDFITLYNSTSLEKITFFKPDDPSLLSGTKVRLHSSSSMLDGVEGVLVKVDGKRNRQFSITIDGWFSIAVPLADIEIIEKIK